ncbi:hypothetical protein EX30DRAFT_397022 [Ascodesmis nigricans]|uniref:RA-domain-containing protein n=1 Tax=Ascodesmis nigricans TaxID=341454 RepID=A0A4S2MQH3_9PEZI|nr:hypothetical protein EX30DRAFT_397022 [Ascodesmis nigricans]
MMPSPDVAGTMRSPRMVEEADQQQRTPPLWRRDADGVPEGVITEWSATAVGDWITSLGLGQYSEALVENEITGDALIRLTHQDLKDMEIISVGHRLTILKAIYNVKVAHNVPFETEDYVPVSAEIDDSKTATQSDIHRLISIIRQRDQRILEHENKLLKMSETLEKLRQDMLPYVKMMKDKSPLPPVANPYPYQRPTEEETKDSPQVQDTASIPPPYSSTLFPPQEKKGLSRKFSMKKLILGTPKSQPSPTFNDNTSGPLYNDYGTTPTAPTHPSTLTNPSTSSLPPQIPPFTSFDHPSPTSPANPLSHSIYDPHTSIPAPSPKPLPRDRDRDRNTPTPMTTRSVRTPGPSFHDDPPSDADRSDSRLGRRGKPPTTTTSSSTEPTTSSSSSQVEIFKSFRVSMEDPCYKVLPAALKRYQIHSDWRNYALYIVYGDQERCLGMYEKPLILFKQLDKEGRKPMFMLRKNAGAGAGGEGVEGMGLQVPGGVL